MHRDTREPVRREEIRIPPLGLEGTLSLPRRCGGLVLFAHGTGSGRASPRNRRVAEALHAFGLGTLLFDLLTEQEAEMPGWSFDIPRLAGRLRLATRWLARSPRSGIPLGYLGGSTGAAAALVAAAGSEREIGAIVCRGGRTDLALAALPLVRAPTLLIVGALDEVVLELNRKALGELRCKNELVLVPGAGHLFEEPGALDEVAALAGRWFTEHLLAEEVA